MQPSGSSGRLSVPLAAGTLLNGRYQVVKVIGSGAFGRVYLAEEVQDPGSPPLAIKELLAMEFASTDEQRDAVSWFKREVGTLLSLSHPGIPAIHGYWTESRTGGALYLVMDYIPGKTMAEVQAALGGQVPWPYAVSWGAGLSDVLAYLHSRTPPCVFRDMKPANVMLDSRSGSPVLIDFGLARQMAPIGVTAVGTWGYVPYEQVLGRAEPRSDLYALGALLHCMITGRQPDAEYRRLLRAGNDVEGALRNLFPFADSLVPDLPPGLSEVLHRATAFDLEDRFPDATSFGAALQSVLDSAGLPSALPPPETLAESPEVLASVSALLSNLSNRPSALTDGLRASANGPVPSAPPDRSVEVAGEAARAVREGERAAPTPPASTPLAGPQPPSSGLRAPQSAPRTPTVPLTPAPPTELLSRPAIAPPAPAASLPVNYEGMPSLEPEEQARAMAAQPIQLAPPTQLLTPSPALPVPVPAPERGGWLRRGPREAAVVPAQAATPAVYTVGAQGQYKTIAAAIARAAPGSRIEIGPGLYRESLVLDRQLELVGAGPVAEIVVEGISASCVLMHTEQAVVRGLTLRYFTGTTDMRHYAVNVPRGHLLLEDCRVTSNSLACIAVHGSAVAATLRRCTMRNVAERGLMIYDHAKATVEDCDITGNTVSLRISAHGSPVIRKCRIHNGRQAGVAISDHAMGTLEDCEIVDNGHHGVTISGGSLPVIRRCRIVRNGWCGISITDNSGATVEFCDLRNNKRGPWEIKLSATNNVRRRGNQDVG